jgi:glutamate/tyrosine decarboxylase-like PLP-dependent enzyme
MRALAAAEVLSRLVSSASAKDAGAAARPPSPARELGVRDALVAQAAGRARRYLDGLAARAVAPSADAVARLDELDFPLPVHGLGAERALALLDDVGSPATVASAGPRYFGFVVGGTLPVALAASWLLAAWDQNAGLVSMSPVGTRLDDVALRWVVDALGLPAGTSGGFTSGATMANAACLLAARDHVLKTMGWDAAGMGLAGSPPLRVVVGDEVHTTVLKALGIIGLGRERVDRLPVDAEGRIRPVDLPDLRPPAIVCLQAGNVNSGSSDPFGPLVRWAHDAGAWVHVDGAFGLWAAASSDVARQVEGVDAADSWATDAHKWLNVTYDCGIALVREPAALEAALRSAAAYLPTTSEREPALFTPQSSQRARGAEVWAVLAALGRDGLAELVSRLCRLARRFASGFTDGGLEVMNEVVLNQVVVALGDAAATDETIGILQREGTCWCGPTTWRGRRAMRVSVSGWPTTEEDVDRSVAAVLSAVRQAGARGS